MLVRVEVLSSSTFLPLVATCAHLTGLAQCRHYLTKTHEDSVMASPLQLLLDPLTLTLISLYLALRVVEV